VTFVVHPWRFCFIAKEQIRFPEGNSSNLLRGVFGSILRGRDGAAYDRVFTPRAGPGSPSGLADSPRPFVFRACHLDDRRIRSGERFHFDVNEFDIRDSALAHFVAAFAELAREGFGPGRGRAELESVWQRSREGGLQTQVTGGRSPAPVELPLTPAGVRASRLRVRFVTPTELKFAGGVVERPEFRVLFSRARDRVSTIRALYGAGPVDLDFRGMGDRAEQICMTRCDIRWKDSRRRSRRTGNVHSIGGFLGEAEYEGDLSEFVPVLRAAEWTGVGRHTVWGNGAIEVD
jgi:hypothetical protein